MLKEGHIPVCVAVILWNHEGCVAGTARREDANLWGLPGGKLEPRDGDPHQDLDETLRRAASRELREETGVEVDHSELNLVFIGVCKDESDAGLSDAVVFTFEAPWLQDLPVSFTPDEGEPEARWVSWDTLCNQSPFAAYNTRVINHLTNG